jgi:hypothetical protein
LRAIASDTQSWNEGIVTLSEAARTGRKFRRKSIPDVWYWLEGKEIKIIGGYIDRAAEAMIDAEMLVATDWEPELLKLEVTSDDIMRAARQLDDLVSKRRLSAAEFGKHLCFELGLIEKDSA